MIKSELYESNIKFNKNSKLIIGIGDSFCAGAGSESIETYERCGWSIRNIRTDKDAIIESYENSFINILSKKYLKDYIPINLAKAGKGNRHAIRELYSNTQFGLENAGDKIVIFVSSGLERFDFNNDIVSVDEHTNTIWPFVEDEEEVGYGSLTFNKKSIYSEQLIVGEFIMDMYMLINWCQINNAKLLFMSGFSNYVDRKKLMKILINDRNLENTDKSELKIIIKNSIDLVNKIPWNKQVKFDGYTTMFDYMLDKQGRKDLIGENKFRDYRVNKHTINDYVSKCQHPTKRAHESFAEIIIKYILNYENLNDVEKIDENEFLKKSMI